MAATAQIFEVVNPESGSVLTLDHFISVKGPVPDWVRRVGKPYTGEIPPGRPIWPVDPAAEHAEFVKATTQPADEDVFFEEAEAIRHLTRATGCKWSQLDFDQRESVGFPGAQRVGGGLLGLPDLNRVAWSKAKIDKWIAATRANVARLERLVGKR